MNTPAIVLTDGPHDTAPEAALSALPIAVVLLDRQGTVCWKNEAADDLLKACDGLRFCNRRLLTKDSADRTRLLRAIGHAVEGRRATIGLAQPFGAPMLVVDVQPLRRRTSLQTATVMAVIRSTWVWARYDANDVAAVFHLSPAEARVTCEICAGPDGVPGAAARLGLSVNTVKTLLQRTFAKTGTRSQGELSTLIASSLVPLTWRRCDLGSGEALEAQRCVVDCVNTGDESAAIAWAGRGPSGQPHHLIR